MTTPAETVPEQAKMSMGARIGWIALICMTLYVCYFSHLGAIGFVGPDEPRYAWIARAMVETGDWVTPRLYDKPWFEKPPLYYWGAAICFKLFGVNEAAARLPSAVSALLATLAMAWLAWRVYGAETAQWLLLLLPTTAGMIGFSHGAATDMPFSGMLTIAMVCAAAAVGLTSRETTEGLAQSRERGTSLEKSRPGRWAPNLLFGFFLGLAVLAKGPAGIILCGGSVFFWALFTKRWREALRLLHPAGIAVFCATALPWYILCARRNPDFLRIFIIEHNFKRYLTPEFQHIQPFWFYVPVLGVALLPWTPALIWTVVLGLRKVRSRHFSHLNGFLLSWCAFCVVFFSASQSKLPGYVLPAIPALGLLIASSVTRATRLLAFSILGTGFLFLGAAIWVRHTEIPIARLGIFLQLTSVLLLVIALAEILISFSFLIAIKAIRCIFLVSSLFVMLVPLAFLEEISERTYAFIISSRPLARGIQATPVCSKLTVHDIPRNFRYGLNFYLHEELSDWDHDSSREICVLAGGARLELPCREIKNMSCKDLWGERDRIELFPTHLLHLVPLAGAADGKPQ